VLVLVDFLGGYFPADDAAEQTVSHDTSIVWDWRHTRYSAEVARTGDARAYYIRSEQKFAVQLLAPDRCRFEFGLVGTGEAVSRATTREPYDCIVRTTRNCAFPLIIRS
jgi:hypothetical protein